MKLARDVLSVYDNLNRALGAADEGLRESAPDFLEGVDLTRREILNVFAKHRIEAVTPEIGARFDANRHQAMFEAPVPGAEPGSVIQVMQEGFVIAERLLRPALVGVAAASSGGAKQQEPASEQEQEPSDDTEKSPRQGSVRPQNRRPPPRPNAGAARESRPRG